MKIALIKGHTNKSIYANDINYLENITPCLASNSPENHL